MIDPRLALNILLDLTKELAQQHSLEEALTAITDAALLLLQGNHASIRLLDDSRSELIAGARSGAGAGARPLSFRPGEGIIGWVADNGRVARVHDTSTDGRFAVGQAQGFDIRSLLVVPLWSGGRVIGVLGLSSEKPGQFTTEHEMLAGLLANCAVPPIEHARLKRVAMTDHRTAALASRYLIPRLAEEIDRARRFVAPLSLLLIDLDRFKEVNDTHGHPVGDRVLSGFADRIRAAIRATDVLVRRGGDEFVLIMPTADLEAARTAAVRIAEDLSRRPLDLGDGLFIRQTVSIGVATWDRFEDAERLEERADQALYEAKRDGRDQVSIAPAPSHPASA